MFCRSQECRLCRLLDGVRLDYDKKGEYRVLRAVSVSIMMMMVVAVTIIITTTQVAEDGNSQSRWSGRSWLYLAQALSASLSTWLSILCPPCPPETRQVSIGSIVRHAGVECTGERSGVLDWMASLDDPLRLFCLESGVWMCCVHFAGSNE